MSNPTSKIEEIETLLLTWKNNIGSPAQAYAQIKDLILELMSDRSLEHISDNLIDLNWHVNRAFEGQTQHQLIAIDKARMLKGMFLVPA